MNDVTTFIENVLADVCMDERIPSGTFDIDNQDHLYILQEYVADKTDDVFAVSLLSELRVVEGQYPERQAYNADGILATFPDEEAKKAALDRGTHFNDNPKGDDDDEVPSDSEDAGEDEVAPDTMFADFDKPEDGVVNPDELEATEQDEFPITPRGNDIEADVKETHHIYDVLSSMKQAQLSGLENKNPDDMVLAGELHPSILFALKQKWEYDKSGKWFDENEKFRSNTDLKGQLDPVTPLDKQEMMMWLDDYLKRHPEL